ncbi:MAG TPA: hypothetical protein VLA56_11400 [Pseudomonadales bacterium]|nr:hypothetical protein [Pseudomonadales bacterium]
MNDPECLSPAARALRAHMSTLCRHAYGSDWADHLEYALWHALVQGPMRYGRLDLDAARIAELRRLRDACGGWITMDRGGRIHWMPLAEWQDRYSGNVDLVRMDEPRAPPGMSP